MEIKQVINVVKTCNCCGKDTSIKQYTKKLHISDYDISEIVEFLEDNNPNAHITPLLDVSITPKALVIRKDYSNRMYKVEDKNGTGELFFYTSIITTEQIDKQIERYFPGLEEVKVENDGESAWLDVAYKISEQLSNDGYIVECYNNTFGKKLIDVLNTDIRTIPN